MPRLYLTAGGLFVTETDDKELLLADGTFITGSTGLFVSIDEATLNTADYLKASEPGDEAFIEFTKDGDKSTGIAQPAAGTSIFLDIDTGLTDGAVVRVEIVDDRVV